jgi:hypothetical protein
MTDSNNVRGGERQMDQPCECGHAMHWHSLSSTDWVPSRFGCLAGCDCNGFEAAAHSSHLSPEPPNEAPEKLYYIQDTRNFVGNSVLWWCPEGNGYTSDLGRAWKVSKAKADSMHRSRRTDVPWPCDEIDNYSQRHFDMQNLRMITAEESNGKH